MEYAQLNTDGTYGHQITTHGNVEWDATHFCPASALTPEEADYFRVVPLQETEAPTYDPLTQSCVRDGGEFVGEQWRYRWRIDTLSPEQIAVKQAEKAAADAQLIRDKIEQLWAAADKYTSSYISGVAIGILTIGVITQKPKALAVTAWSSQVWGTYYARKAAVTVDSMLDLDFSGAGPMPFSVPELQAELGL